ncbi:unnamed protein product [Brassica napus]|uniref:(rape) hypothetical protein n=1 Tax=Brassica napus TaxID=3708 RepID=A0A816KWI9_BRANA|nr:unnamed protein product [Brassica napus]
MNKVHGLFLVVIFSLAYTQLVKCQSKPSCQTKCGNVSIEYPFGTSPDCYYAGHSTFLLTCDETKNKLFTGNLQVINISHTGELRILNSISYSCYNSTDLTDRIIYNTTLVDFTLSNKNSFTAVGCNTYAVMTTTIGDRSYSTGCLSLCDSTQKEDGLCSGEGCCQTSVSSDFNPCFYAFLVEEGMFSFSPSQDLQNLRNVTEFPGCYLETEVPLLVYEFINSGTLYDRLHGSMSDSSLTWEHRLRIAVEIAGTLAYLHSSASIPIIHRDVKTANILLDENLTAKVADFGASRLIPMDKEQLTTMVQGTLGYLDPQYYNTGLLNEKSDVYSFGVVLMELLTGQKALCFEKPQQSKHLVNYFASAMKENRLHEVIDGQVMKENKQREIHEAARIAVECTRLMGVERPRMKEVAAQLEALRVGKTKHEGSDQYNEPEVNEHLVGVEILSAQGDTSTTGYDSIKNVTRLHIEAGR